MSFNPLIGNDRVSVIRARMEAGAREGFHSKGSDTIVVHLTCHSARNIGGSVDVALKPR